MIERFISIYLLALGGIIIAYATALSFHAETRDAAARLLSSGALLGVTLIAFGVLIDRDRRRSSARTAAAPLVVDAGAHEPARKISSAPIDLELR